MSIVKEFALGIGDEITVYKANMIIPQIAENLTRSGNVVIPDTCPSCGGKTVIRNENGTETLVCINPDCPAKNIKLFSLFVSRNAMNIDGISEATLEKFIAEGFLHGLSDIYKLQEHRDRIVSLEGFGEKSYNNILSSIDKSRECSMAGFLYGLGITGVGVANAKLIVKSFGNDFDKIMNASVEELRDIDQIGDVIARDFTAYMSNEKNRAEIEKLRQEISFIIEENNSPQDLAGKTFVITKTEAARFLVLSVQRRII